MTAMCVNATLNACAAHRDCCILLWLFSKNNALFLSKLWSKYLL